MIDADEQEQLAMFRHYMKTQRIGVAYEDGSAAVMAEWFRIACENIGED